MRTPGQDRELAAGFLYSEGILCRPDEVAAVFAHGNVVRVETTRGAGINRERRERNGYVTTSFGVCGKTNMGSLNEPPPRVADSEPVSASLISELPSRLRDRQQVFDSTGGLHASALFDFDGKLLNIAEDVGRHNALDKLIGVEFLRGALPLSRSVLLLSGRASYELIHKAAAAQIPIVAAVGAPSSLAVQIADEAGITLAGFVRNGSFNIYCGAQRIVSL
jgi:FdhD protein